jgi:hypothetical protein
MGRRTTFRIRGKRKPRTVANYLSNNAIRWLGREDSNLRMAESKSYVLTFRLYPDVSYSWKKLVFMGFVLFPHLGRCILQLLTRCLPRAYPH